MALTFDAVTDAVAAQGDVSSTTAAQYVNNRLARMLVESEYERRTSSIGNTVAAQATYTLPSDVVNLRAVRVGTTLYNRVAPDDIWNIQDGRSFWSSGGLTGLVAQYFDSTGTTQIELYPAPTASGTAINAIQVWEPATIAYGSGNTLSVLPEHVKPYLVDGGLADVYERSDERQDLASFHEQRFTQGVQALQRLRNAVLKSDGPYRITVTR